MKVLIVAGLVGYVSAMVVMLFIDPAYSLVALITGLIMFPAGLMNGLSVARQDTADQFQGTLGAVGTFLYAHGDNVRAQTGGDRAMAGLMTTLARAEGQIRVIDAKDNSWHNRRQVAMDAQAPVWEVGELENSMAPPPAEPGLVYRMD